MDEHLGVSNDEQPTYSNGQNGNVEMAWNNGQGNGGQGDHYGDLAVEPEIHGIGIKEDG